MINKVLCWNCRGAGSLLTKLHLIDLVDTHRPDILAVLETQIPSDKFITWLPRLGMDGFLASEATGFAGGIWLMWDTNKIQLDPFVLNDQMVIAAVSGIGMSPFLLSIVYASPNPMFRSQLWDYIRAVGGVIDLPWLLLGDFNQVVAAHDKRGGCPFNPSRAQLLVDTIQACHLLDLGYQGPSFTWTNGRKGNAHIRERLDRAWCNLAWQHSFGYAWVRHLPRAHLDHHPLLLSGLSVDPPARFRGFQFLDAWFSHL